ncbi:MULTISPECIES: neutral/alkaline non-lysosomal ceramidase N-terminal domain-containing protein [Bacillus cereus group]|uniref:neutral/alkaline non-lysosomal ceramidase N-terminal domain-containing protein n=1 Tax=Bacillus cereus group TaxID=86661 RepID=UPI0008FDBC46|nr:MULTISPECIES: neutral/alkaline non-lysosomal ceramidase N-terminal domain-containing protein [Bacillus cereus group]MDG1619302.1 neutral/alkaline non-lysosomal ceramidase N-terminal domain-containing protein [Bacillus mobilis]MDX5838737.1 neutral/alkaline non-lysosomal ceramidase N-terminal domain-containing protein [Bacillus cereus group sp. BfR-BA-01700]MED4384360.1 neutral/alkaline non-lysosomal ceramidase N-terminal domain-containing protein [Bacillus mobilis]OJE38956.1 alkaline ceramida
MSKIGVCKVDITPPVGIDFVGYHRETGINNIEERIYGTVFVFEKDEMKTVFISIDNIGMLVEDTNMIRERVASRLHVPFERITVVYTHTHSGPETVGKQPLVKSYKTSLVNNVVHGAVTANNNLKLCEVGWGVTIGDIGINRRERTSDGRAKMGTNIKGVVDKRIGMLAIRNAETKELSGIIVFCTAHPNVLKGDSDALSADYPGMTRETLEKIVNCPVIIVQGAAGNINAKYRGSREAVKQMAYMLSGHVLTMLPTVTYSPIVTVRTVSSTMQMKLKDIPEMNEIRSMAQLAEKQWGVNTDEWLTIVLKKYMKGIRQLRIDLEVQLFQVNDGMFFGIPMEPFSETALEVKESLRNELAFFGGYTNGYIGYLPTREEFAYGGYEVELNPIVYGTTTNLLMPPEENTADVIVQKVIELYEKELGNI